MNPDLCQGHNRCKALAPTLFELDTFGNATATNDGWVSEDDVALAEKAIDNCPEFAIERIESDSEGDEL